jgi:hypothetical protein
MARKFETEYRASKTAEVLKNENNFRLSVDLRLDALERGLADLGSDASVLVARVVRAIETEISPRAAEIEVLLADYRDGVPAASVQEEDAGRQFLTPERQSAILADLRGGVAGDYDTLAKIVMLVAGKATPADITAAINALKGSAPATYDTLQEIAAWIANDETAEAAIMAALGNRVRFDSLQALTTPQKIQGLANLGVDAGFFGYFAKADRASTAFTKTGAGSISLKAGTAIELAGLIYSFAADTAVQMPALTAGTDYAVYLCDDGTLRADANFSTPPGFTTATSRQIGGFHYAPGGNATAQAGGDTTPAINPYSIWDLKWRPACSDPRGMTLVAGSFWVDIYLCGVDHGANGTSRYNVSIADGSSPPKIPALFGGDGSADYVSFNWWQASEVMQAHGKDLLSYAEFAAAAYGATENTSAGTDPVSTILRQAYTSRWGLMLATGNLYVWGRDISTRWDGTGGWAWRDSAGSRGQLYIGGDVNLVAALFGGGWAEAAHSGSRASSWSPSPWSSLGSIGARGRCDHLCHV